MKFDLEKKLKEIWGRPSRTEAEKQKLESELLKAKKEKAALEERLNSENGGESSAGRIAKSVLKGAALLGAYAAEVYYLAIPYHTKMYSLAQSWYTGYDKYLEKANAKFFNRLFGHEGTGEAAIGHVIGDGFSGLVIGAITAIPIGIVGSLTYYLIKRDFPSNPILPIVATGACGALGGLFGAEFSDAKGIMIGSYIGTAIGALSILGAKYESEENGAKK